MQTVIYTQGADLPDLQVTWKNNAGSVIDFSSGWTFELRVGDPAAEAALVKTTGISGAATEPNVTIAWAITDDLDSLDPDMYTAQLIATRVSDDKQRIMPPFKIKIQPAILPVTP